MTSALSFSPGTPLRTLLERTLAKMNSCAIGVSSQNDYMPKLGKRKVSSLREIARFNAVDGDGVSHTVVERIEIETRVTFANRYTHTETGLKSYYSSTSGDVLVRLLDGTFEGCSGLLKLQLGPVPKAGSETM